MDADRSPNAATLPDLLALARSGSLNGQIRDALVPTHLANLAVLAPGTTEADDLVDGLPALLEALTSSGIDVTVIAAPALLEDPSATILAWSTRSVLWVIEAGEVTEPEARSGLAPRVGRCHGVRRCDGRRQELTKTTVELKVALDPSARLRIVPAATRMLGSDLLVNIGGATAPVQRIVGSGPESWSAFEQGLSIAEATTEVSSQVGVAVPGIEANVLRFAAGLVEAGLAHVET